MWSAYLFQTVTGRVGIKLEVVSCSWSVDLNSIETLNVTVKKSSFPAVTDYRWFEPWWAGIVLFWNDIPIVAGVTLGNPTETFDTVEFTCAGIRSLLSRRTVIPDSNLYALATSVVQYKGETLGNIAQEAVKIGIEKEGGNLPIDFVIPRETMPPGDTHTRTYRGYNVGNIFVDDVLTKLSESADGPDIMFIPRSNEFSRIWWEMVHGTKNNPRIAQTVTPVWDISAARGSVTNFSTVKTGAFQTDRVFGIGAGEDEGTLIQIAQDLSRIQDEYPLLETTIKDDSEIASTIMSKAQGNLDANRAPLHEISITVRADGIYPLGSFWPGDEVEIVVSGWFTIANGRHKARLIGMSGDLSKNIKLTVQIES